VVKKIITELEVQLIGLYNSLPAPHAHKKMGYLLFLLGLEFEPMSSSLQNRLLFHLSHTSSPFCSGYFGDWVLQTISLGWL
jgi:hypothetical protein